ncbi:MAG: hypothetical protein NZ954_07180 [Thermofilaceae archaeon]|nr:hypothetical protein [Thermofilaceae archaeon]
MKFRVLKSCKVTIVILALLMSLQLISVVVVAESGKDADPLSLAKEIDTTNVKGHVKTIVASGSRLTGYEGYQRVSRYIARTLEQYGLNVTYHKFKVVVPIDEGSKITILDERGSPLESFSAFSLWPNGVNPSRTPPEGISGRLVYVGRGKLTDLDGKHIEGSIVLMDYNSYDNWIIAAGLGARAIIFIEPEDVPPYFESMRKFTDTPLNLPRLYVSKDIGARLRKFADGSTTVNIFVDVKWKEVEAENVIGILEGESRIDTLLLTASFDSWSPVPALARSAHEALSASYLLELARVLSSARKPPRTILFVFFSGYWQALAGPREFVERYYFGPEIAEGKFRPLMLINVGLLDPEGIGLQLMRGGHGTFYGTTSNMGGLSLRYAWVLRKITEYLSNPEFRAEIYGVTGIEPNLYVRDFFTNEMYWGTEAYPYMLASEPAEMTGGVAFTIQSAYATKLWLGSPVDDLPLLEESLDKLRSQLVAMTYLVVSFVYERNWGIRWNEVAPSRIRIIGPSAQYSSFITLRGKVLTYNLTVGWYSVVPNAIVRVYVGSFTVMNGYSSPPYPFNKIIAISNERGEFEIHGLAAYPLIPGVGAAGGGLVRSMYAIEAWKFDENSGRIIYAPDFGLYGAKAIPPTISPLAHPEEASVVVGKFNVLTLFDLFNPKEGRPPVIPDHRTLSYGDAFTAFYAVGGGVQVLDFNMRGEPLFYGSYFNGYEPIGLAFFQPGSKVTALFRTGGLAQPIAARPMAVVVNASSELPEGSGVSEDGTSVNAFDYVRDLLLVAKARYGNLAARSVRSLSVEEKLSLAEQLHERAVRTLAERKYSEAYSQAVAAWAVAQRAYEETMSLVDDSSRTSLFFFALIIPTAIFMERLFFHKEGRLRILSTILTGGILVAFFAASHPALQIMTNSFMALLGMVAVLLFSITVSILTDETRQALRELSFRLLGMHEIETRRAAVTSSAFTVALENMRKRKVRTFLTILTFLSITIAVTSLTSISPFETLKEVPLRSEPSYPGLLLKSGFGVPPRDVYHPTTVRLVEGIIESADAEASVRPRAWYYPPSIGPRMGATALVSTEQKNAGNNTYRVFAAIGMTPEDVKATLGPYLTPGSRVFFVGEDSSCIIPDVMARQLSIDLGDVLVFQGLRLIVVGVYNASIIEADSPKELDGYSLTPIDPHYVSQLGLGVTVPAQQTPPPLSWSAVIVLPHELALKLGGYVSMVSVRFYTRDHNALSKVSKLLSLALDVPVITSDGGRILALSRYYSFTAIGWEMIPVVLAIGALNAAVTLLGNFRERLREMFVYASLGLTPLGAAVMYVIESLTYASLSITIGYFIGFITNSLLISTGLLPPHFTFNYASIFVVLSLAILLITAFASSLSVAANAATLITPSLERKWRPPTKPRRGVWEVPLPVSLPTREEALGLIEFLREYYEGLGAERAAFSVRSLHTDLNELCLRGRVALAPYELGITQGVEIQAVYNQREARFQLLAKITHETGSEQMWERLSYYFLDDLRKQLLLWRALSVEEHRRYAARAVENL